MPITLSKEELIDLTGYKVGKFQQRWLADQLGIKAPLGVDGLPKVTPEVVKTAMLAKSGMIAVPSQVAGQQPNWTRKH